MGEKTAGMSQSEFGGTAGKNPPPPPPTPPASGKPQRKMIELKAPELFKFKASGDFVEGIFVSAEKVQVAQRDEKGNVIRMSSAVEYVFANGHERFQILGTYDINKKLGPEYKGLWVQITFKRLNQDVVRNGNAMMEFLVEVEDKSGAFSDGQQITDEDIPF